MILMVRTLLLEKSFSILIWLAAKRWLYASLLCKVKIILFNLFHSFVLFSVAVISCHVFLHQNIFKKIWFFFEPPKIYLVSVSLFRWLFFLSVVIRFVLRTSNDSVSTHENEKNIYFRSSWDAYSFSSLESEQRIFFFRKCEV